MKKIPYKTHDEWLELRKAGLGGSDAYQIILNEYGSKFSVWLDKTNRDMSEKKESVPMKHGTLVESAIREWFIAETGLKVDKPSYVIHSDFHPFMFASLDGLGVDADGEPFIFEAKDTWSFKNEPILSSGDIPKYWIIQLHHYFAVTGIKKAYIAYWFGNRIMDWQLIERDDDLCDMIVKIETDFWENNVLKDIEPEIDFADERTSAYINDKFNQLVDETIDRPDIIDIAKRQYEIGQQISTLTNERKALTLQLKNTQGKFRKMTAGLYEISNSRVLADVEVFDIDNFKSENEELYEKYCSTIQKKSGKYTIKKIKEAK